VTLAKADEGQPTPIMDGNCSVNGPAQGEAYLYANANFGGTCWRIRLPSGATYSQTKNVTLINITNDAISSAKVGPATEVDFFSNAWWGGTLWYLYRSNGINDKPNDANFGLAPWITNFNDQVTSLKLYTL
jgi:hypothetical protein